MTALTDHDGSATRYDRDAEGKIIKEYHPDGSTTEYAYNNIGQLVEQKEVTAANATLRKITYAYDDAGNLTMEQRSGVDVDKKDENVRYYYDKDNQLIKTTVEGKTTQYTYDLAGNLLSDGISTYTYNNQNQLLAKTGSDGTTTYTYDFAGNLLKTVSPDGSTEYSYDGQNRMVKGENSDGSYSEYTYNALGVRTQNIQYRHNVNSGYANADLNNGSAHIKDYLPALSDDRADWQSTWESEVGSVHQNDFETVTTHFTVDYLSEANRDIIATVDGAYTARYVYDLDGTRISAELSYADGTVRGTTNANGEYGENPASDIAVKDISKVWYRTNLTGSSLYVVDKDGETVSHAIYDPWGKSLTETAIDENFMGLESLNNYTGYSWDETLGLYFAQNRFYDAETHRFTQSDPIEDGTNWYTYVENNPLTNTDPYGYGILSGLKKAVSTVKSAVSGAAKKVTSVAKTVVSKVTTTAQKAVTAVKTTAAKAVTAVKKTATAVTTAVKQTAQKAATVVKQTAQTVKTAAVTAATAVKNTAIAVKDSVVTAVKSVDWKAVGQAALDTAVIVGGVALTAATFGVGTAIVVAGGALAVTAYQAATSTLRGETVTAGDVLHNMAFNTTFGVAMPALYSNPVTAAITTYALTGLGATATVSSGVRLANDISNGASGGTIVADIADTALFAFGTYKGVQGCMEIARCATAQTASNQAVTEAEATVRNRVGHPVEPLERTYDMALDPETYARAVAEKYGINLRGSGQEINLKFNPDLTPGTFGKTRAVTPNVIEFGPDALYNETELANTIAHELNHARSFLSGGLAPEETAYHAGDTLANYILGGR